MLVELGLQDKATCKFPPRYVFKKICNFPYPIDQLPLKIMSRCYINTHLLLQNCSICSIIPSIPVENHDFPLNCTNPTIKNEEKRNLNSYFADAQSSSVPREARRKTRDFHSAPSTSRHYRDLTIFRVTSPLRADPPGLDTYKCCPSPPPCCTWCWGT